MGQHIDNLGRDAQQAKLEHLEKPHGACTDDQGIGLDG
jgi:hypothetical protein